MDKKANKFQIINNLNDLKNLNDMGLFYYLPTKDEKVINIISEYIDNILSTSHKTQIYAGMKTAISDKIFFENNISIDPNTLNISHSLINYCYNIKYVNPIRFTNERIILWGNRIRMIEGIFSIQNATVLLDCLNYLSINNSHTKKYISNFESLLINYHARRYLNKYYIDRIDDQKILCYLFFDCYSGNKPIIFNILDKSGINIILKIMTKYFKKEN